MRLFYKPVPCPFLEELVDLTYRSLYLAGLCRMTYRNYVPELEELGKRPAPRKRSAAKKQHAEFEALCNKCRLQEELRWKESPELVWRASSNFDNKRYSKSEWKEIKIRLESQYLQVKEMADELGVYSKASGDKRFLEYKDWKKKMQETVELLGFKAIQDAKEKFDYDYDHYEEDLDVYSVFGLNEDNLLNKESPDYERLQKIEKNSIFFTAWLFLLNQRREHHEMPYYLH